MSNVTWVGFAASLLLDFIAEFSAAFRVEISFFSGLCFLVWKQERLELPAHINNKFL